MRRSIRFIALVLATGMLVAPNARAATLAPVNVLSDPTLDNLTTEDDTPLGGASDLIAAAIGETDDAIQLVWQLKDFPDVFAPPAFLPVVYYYEFKLTNPNNGASGLFSVRVRLYPDEPRPSTNDPTNVPPPMVPPVWPFGSLNSNCQTVGNLVSCTWNREANVTVTVDGAANTVTASVPRQFLKSNNGEELAVDGATLVDQVLFIGVASCVSTVAVISAGACDDGAMEEEYTLGTPRE